MVAYTAASAKDMYRFVECTYLSKRNADVYELSIKYDIVWDRNMNDCHFRLFNRCVDYLRIIP